LHAVQGGLTAKPEIEQSDCFVFQKGEVITYNVDVACHMKSCLPIEGAVNAKKMLDMLAYWPDEKITFKWKPGRLQFRGEAKTGYFVMQDVITLPVKDVEHPKKWVRIPEGFWEGVQLVVECAAHNSELPHLNCVHFTSKQVQACDGRQAGRCQIKTPFHKPILLRRSAVKSVISLEPAGIAQTDNWVHFRKKKEGIVISCRKCLDEYPVGRLDKIFSLSGDSITLPQNLRGLIDRLEVFLDEASGMFWLEVDITAKELRITGRGIYGKQTERQETDYKGKPISFSINPKLFRELASRHDHCSITNVALKIDKDNFQYVTALIINDEKEE
jgi:hypothetical protein